MRTRILFLAKCAVAAGLLYLLLAAGLIDLEKLARVRERWGFLALAHLCFACGITAAGVRWYALLRAQSIPASPREVASLVLIGWCFNQTMPSNTGGDVARGVAIAVDHPAHRHAAIVSIAADRAIGLVTLLAVALCGAALNQGYVRAHPALGVAVVGIAALLGAALAAIGLFYSRRTRALARRAIARLRAVERRSEDRASDVHERGADREDAASRRRAAQHAEAHAPREKRWIAHAIARALHSLRALAVQMDEAAYVYRSRPRAVALAIVASTVMHLMTIALNLSLTWALLGEPFAWSAMLFVIPLAHALMAVGFTPGGLGVTEGIYASLLPLVGISQGAAIAILQRLIWLMWAAAGAAVFAVRRAKLRAPQESAKRDVV